MPATLRRTRAAVEHIQRHSKDETTHLACVRFLRALRVYENAWERAPHRIAAALDALGRATTDLTGDPGLIHRVRQDPRYRSTPHGVDEPLAERLRALPATHVPVDAIGGLDVAMPRPR